MTETDRIEAIAQQCRAARYPESLIDVITAYLSSQGTLAQAQEAWQAALHRNSGLYPTFIHPPIFQDEPQRELDLRLLDLGLFSGQLRHLLSCMAQHLSAEQIRQYLALRGIDEQHLLKHAVGVIDHGIDQAGTPTGLGQIILSSLPDQFDEILKALPGKWYRQHLVGLLVAAQPPLIDLAWQLTQQIQNQEHPDSPSYSRSVNAHGGVTHTYYYYSLGPCARALLKADPLRFTPWVRELAGPSSSASPYSRVIALQALLAQNGAHHLDLALEAARTPLPDRHWESWESSTLQCVGLEALITWNAQSYWPLLEEAALSRNLALERLALRLLSTASVDQACLTLQRCVASGSHYSALAALAVVLKQAWDGQEAYALSLLAHRSKQVRDRISAWLAARGEGIIKAVAVFLTHRQAQTRLAAVQTLQRVGGARVQILLEARLSGEKAQRVRDAILDVVSIPVQGARLLSRETIIAEAEAIVTYLPKSSPLWFTGEDAPPLHWKAGEVIPSAVLQSLLYRQSRHKGAQIAAYNRQTLALIDHATSGDLALALFKSWLRHGAKAKDAWLLPLVGALGDERLVPLLRLKIEEWGLGTRRTLAAQAALALALIESGDAIAELANLARQFKQGRLKRKIDEALAVAARR